MADDSKHLVPTNVVEEPLDLIPPSMDERIHVKMSNERELLAKLHAYDQHLNMILGDVDETVTTVSIEEEIYNNNNCTKRDGMIASNAGTSRKSADGNPIRINLNQYATKKTIAQGLLDIALLTANAAQLKYVLLSDGKHSFYTAMLVLISLSIILQVLAGICVLILITINLNQTNRLHFADILNNLVTGMIFVITVVNVSISAFGLEDSQTTRYSSAKPEVLEESTVP